LRGILEGLGPIWGDLGASWEVLRQIWGGSWVGTEADLRQTLGQIWRGAWTDPGGRSGEVLGQILGQICRSLQGVDLGKK
jgi:hypothetical protein